MSFYEFILLISLPSLRPLLTSRAHCLSASVVFGYEKVWIYGYEPFNGSANDGIADYILY